jgi:ABC-type uncharacterized transport system ATPase subunit
MGPHIVFCTLELGIMKQGQFMCLGTLQHLRQRFSTGYAVQIKVAKEKSVDNVRDALTLQLPGIEILGMCMSMKHIQIHQLIP